METSHTIIPFEPFLVGSRNGKLVKEIAKSLENIEEYTDNIVGNSLDTPLSGGYFEDLTKKYCRGCDTLSDKLYYFLDENDDRKLHGGYCSHSCYSNHKESLITLTTNQDRKIACVLP